MSYFSTVPDAISALVAMCQASTALAGVQVSDGPPLTNTAAMEVLAVGYNPGEDVDSVEMAETFGDLGSSRDREQYTIHCSLGVINGDRDTLLARTRAYALFDAVGFAINGDTTLRKTVMNARVATHNLRQSDTDAGILARINFGIAVDAFTGK